jgi:cobyric acid synthase
MPKLTREQWATVRERWESDPRKAHQWLVDELKSQGLEISRTAIAKMAARHDWSKTNEVKNVTRDGNVNGEGNITKSINKKVDAKVTQAITNALIRLIENHETPPELVFQACEKLLKLGNQS